MFKKPSKKQLLIRRIAFSVLATFAVLVIVTVTVLSMLGFRLDSHNGRLEQGALLQLDSLPGGANVLIDGDDTGSRTATKRTLIAGTHNVTMTKDQYEHWTRTLSIEPGTLTWLNYVRLVPKERTPQSVAEYKTLSQLEFSPGGRWALAHETAASSKLKLIDLRSETVKTTELTIPAALYSEAETPAINHAFEIRRWNPAGRYVLVKHTYGPANAHEWLVLDTENITQSSNVTRTLSVEAHNLDFAGTNGKSLYALTNDNSIRKLDLAAGTISRALVTHVKSFSVFDTTILSYVGTDPTDATKQVAGIYRDGDEFPHILRTVDNLETTLHIAAGKYYGDDFVAIAEGNIVSILKGSYPGSTSQDASTLHEFAEMELIGAVNKLSFGPASDIVFAQTDTAFGTYEIEHRRHASAELTGDVRTSLQWIDNAYLSSIIDGKLVMRDFDNSNNYTIATADAAFGSSLSTNGRFYYMVAKNDNGYQLQRVRMILE